MKIGARLTLCFLIVVLLMVASYAFTLWQFNRVRKEEERLHNLDQESQAVLSLHANLLALRGKLEDLAASEDSHRFTAEAESVRSQFLDAVAHADRSLRNPSVRRDPDPTTISTFETIQSSLPVQIDALAELASAGDWPAVRLRLQNQVRPLSSLTAQLVETVDREVTAERIEARQSIQRLERRVFLMHIAASFFALLVAAVLGTTVTRSITRPLARLDAGAQALALGNFQHRVEVEGSDELATLGLAFNDAAGRLSNLYGALKTSEERFRTVVATAPVGIAVLDEGSRIQIFNQRFLDIVGLTAEQVAGLRLSDARLAVLREDGTPCPTDERPSQKASATGKPVLDVVVRNFHSVSGEQRWILASAWPLLRGDGGVYQVIATLTDITEQKNVEEELRRREEEFHTIFEHAAIGMALLDPSGRFLRSNPAFRQILGYTEEELASMTFTDVTHPEDLAPNRALYRDVIDGKRDRYQIKKRYVRKDGDIRSARVNVSALRVDGGALQSCIAMVEDITLQEQAEHTLLQMSDRLLRIQEEEQRRIAREVHDSTSQEMTALTLNLGALKALEDRVPEKARKQIAESLALAKRVAREIRTFSYLLHPPMLNELGLWAALRMFVEEFRERSGLSVSLDISSEVEPAKLQSGQEMALYRFVQEGLANVHRHSGSKTASVNVQLKGNFIEASIADTGRGIPSALLAEIQAASGLAGGVGIPGMRERVRYVGGNLQILSDEHGTTVIANVPVSDPSAASPHDAKRAPLAKAAHARSTSGDSLRRNSN